MSCDQRRVPLPNQYQPFTPEQQQIIDQLADRLTRLEGVHHPVIVRHR